MNSLYSVLDVENCSEWDFSQLSTKISFGPGFLEIFENFVQFLSIWNCHKLLNAFSERELIRGFCLSNISMQHEKRKFSLGWQNEVSSLDSNNLISTFRELKPDAMLSAIKSSWKISTSFFMHWCQFQNLQMTDEQISTTISELFRFILWWVRWEGEGRFPGEMRQEGEVSGELKSEKLAFLETILSRSVFWYMLRNIHIQMFWNPLESSQFESLTSRVCLKGPNIDKRKVSNLRIFLPSDSAFMLSTYHTPVCYFVESFLKSCFFQLSVRDAPKL